MALLQLGQDPERCGAAAPESFLATDWESRHPLPLFLNLSLDSSIHPRDAQTGEPWCLATDDATLVAAGLPPFSTSLARYLTAGGPNPRYIPITKDAPESAQTTDAKTASHTGQR